MSPLFSKWVKHGGVILWSDAESEWLHLKFCSDYRLQEEPRRTSILQYLNKKKKEKEHDTTRQHLTKYITAANSNYPSTQPRWWQIVSYPTSSVHFDKTNFPLTHRIPQSSHLWTFPVVSTMGSVGCVELKARKRRRGEIESRKVEGGARKRKRLYPAAALGVSRWASFETFVRRRSRIVFMGVCSAWWRSQLQLVLWDLLVEDREEGTQDFL